MFPDLATIEQLTERIIGCAIEVHKALGAGLLESVYRELDWVGGTASYAAATRLGSGMTGTGFFIGRFAPTRVANVLLLLLTLGFIALLLQFGLTNHRSADRPAGRVWKQVILMAAFVTAGVITLAAVQSFRR